MSPAHLLVDLENVQPDLEHLRSWLADPAGSVWVFHAANQKKLVQSFSLLGNRLTAVPTMRPGKNALDFQLVFYLGYLAAKNNACRFVVLSNDKGYDPALEHARVLGLDVRRQSVPVRTAAVASSKASKTVKAAKAAKAAKKSKAAGKAAPAKAHPAVKPGPASNGKVKKSAAAELTAREAAGPELIKRVVDDLRVQSKHRPRTRKTLENRVASLLNGKIEKGAEPHIVDTVAELGAVRFDGVRAVYDDARLATLTTS